MKHPSLFNCDIIATKAGMRLSERDSLRVLDLLRHPPAAPDRLIRATQAGATAAEDSAGDEIMRFIGTVQERPEE